MLTFRICVHHHSHGLMWRDFWHLTWHCPDTSIFLYYHLSLLHLYQIHLSLLTWHCPDTWLSLRQATTEKKPQKILWSLTRCAQQPAIICYKESVTKIVRHNDFDYKKKVRLQLKFSGSLWHRNDGAPPNTPDKVKSCQFVVFSWAILYSRNIL